MLVPDMYYKDVFSINYDKLKQMGIKYLLVDLDNTLKEIGGINPREDVKDLMTKLNKDFKVILFSNNISPGRVEYYAKYFNIDFIVRAGKPRQKGFHKALKYTTNKDEMCIIGDQLLTDVKGGKRFGIKTIFVDRLGKKDEPFTFVNRLIEKRIMREYKKQNRFEKGKYYD